MYGANPYVLPSYELVLFLGIHCGRNLENSRIINSTKQFVSFPRVATCVEFEPSRVWFQLICVCINQPKIFGASARVSDRAVKRGMVVKRVAEKDNI